jgi:hypothetical protein
VQPACLGPIQLCGPAHRGPACLRSPPPLCFADEWVPTVIPDLQSHPSWTLSPRRARRIPCVPGCGPTSRGRSPPPIKPPPPPTLSLLPETLAAPCRRRFPNPRPPPLSISSAAAFPSVWSSSGGSRGGEEAALVACGRSHVLNHRQKLVGVASCTADHPDVLRVSVVSGPPARTPCLSLPASQLHLELNPMSNCSRELWIEVRRRGPPLALPLAVVQTPAAPAEAA